MAKQKILIVEDEENISTLIDYNLRNSGFICAVAPNGEDALQKLGKSKFDLAILDVMLPGIDGYEVCRKIKKDPKISDMPILMLTAKGEEIDKIVGFELGADDYMTKPFSPRELVLRIKAILKRKYPSETEPELKDIVTVDQIKIDLPRHKVFVDEKEIELTLLEFNLLLTLIRRRGRVQTRDTLLSDVWGIDSDIYSRTIDTHMRNLRKKLGKMQKYIHTVRGMGYKFEEEK
jgi:two-component system, OmpR family, phosphate regulon response regulator PhoB